MLAVAGVLACREGASLTFVELGPPRNFQVTPVGLSVVRLEWDDIGGSEVQTYRIERRENLQGEFKTLTRVSRTSGRVIYLDTSVEPETFYGYRVFSVNTLGNESEPSMVEGGKTPSRPGIRVQTLSLVPPEISDQDGYQIEIDGPEKAQAVIGVNSVHRFSPLPVGGYAVRLAGVSAACRARPGEALTKNVTVTDQGTETIQNVAFAITCRDPSRGQIVAGVQVTGDQVPSQATLVIEVSGIATDKTLPESERVYARTLTFGPAGGATLLENLRVGEFVLLLRAVPVQCVRQGTDTRRVTTLPLSSDSVLFEVRCGSAAPNAPPTAVANGPYIAEPNVPIPFSAAGSTDADGSIVSYAWQFGDGTTGSGASPTKAYAAAGSYSVTLTVTDDRGGTGTATTTATIGNQPPVARSNGPYSGTVGVPVQLSATGSTDPDGSIASYRWDFGDGETGVNSSVGHVYDAEGTYRVTLTVTDNHGATDTDQATVAITPATGGSSFTWTNTFGTVDAGTQIVTMVLTLDLQGNTPNTPGSEALDRWVVDALTWDPRVLQFFAFSFGSGGSGSVDVNEAVSAGKLKLFGTQAASASTGLITLGTVRFRVIGSNGSRTTTATTLGLLLGTAATGSYSYLSETSVSEGTYTIGGGSTPTGTVAGTLTRSTGGAVVGAAVTVAPGGTATSGSSGQYTVANVAVGSGTVTVSNVPSGCTAPAAKPYAIGGAGQTATVDFTVTCAAASPNAIRGTWTVSGTTATLELRANVTQGALASLQADYNVNSARLQYTGFSPPANPSLGNAFAANPPATKVNFGAFTTNPSGATGDVGIIRLTFTILAGAAQTVNGSISGFGALNPAFANITPTFQGNVAVDPLTLP